MITIDHRTMRTAIRAHVDQVKAVRQTIAIKGRAEVGTYTAHGREVVASMAQRGKFPLTPTPEMERAATEIVERHAGDAIRRAAQSKRVARVQIQQALMRGAGKLAQLLKERIISGGLGQNTEGWRRVKTRYQFTRGPSRYGIPAAYGIFTGRFLESIRSVWRSR